MQSLLLLALLAQTPAPATPVAPDLLSGAAPGGGRTADFPSSDAAREGISKLDADQVTRDLAALADYAKALPAANGKIAVAGLKSEESADTEVGRDSVRSA